MSYDVLVSPWDPTCGKFGREETLANQHPLTEAEADEMLAELLPCVDDYHGQGLTLHGARKVRR